MIPSHFVIAVYVEACLFRWGFFFFFFSMPSVKKGLRLVSQNPMTVAVKRVISFVTVSPPHPTRDQNSVTTERCNKYFHIYHAPLSWA